MNKPIRHKTNPFLKKMDLVTKKKGFKIVRNRQYTVVDKAGEIVDCSLTLYKLADTAEFIKLYANCIGSLLDLKSDAIKSFMVVLYALHNQGKNKHIVEIDKYVLADFFEEFKCKKFSLTYFNTGLRSLEDNEIIAKTEKKGKYYINPAKVFKGDRLALVTVIERIAPEDIPLPLAYVEYTI